MRDLYIDFLHIFFCFALLTNLSKVSALKQYPSNYMKLEHSRSSLIAVKQQETAYYDDCIKLKT